ncbi:uncharacterized protein EI90DRAFT_145601 [Cantharellus anzutake]|uniref:uncharacterized protein n=1 Tax=Cantharellus anzutake TaxID=1750568 RepID=UPI0019052342|nr:uncharacterized protein EI90DRAFT_145601 [Cantharellus anzutake]KAF8317538.1 hypothetical protein EI90DRAFT_145601 [Cantharellus anzutake]
MCKYRRRSSLAFLLTSTQPHPPFLRHCHFHRSILVRCKLAVFISPLFSHHAPTPILSFRLHASSVALARQDPPDELCLGFFRLVPAIKDFTLLARSLSSLVFLSVFPTLFILFAFSHHSPPLDSRTCAFLQHYYSSCTLDNHHVGPYRGDLRTFAWGLKGLFHYKRPRTSWPFSFIHLLQMSSDVLIQFDSMVANCPGMPYSSIPWSVHMLTTV